MTITTTVRMSTDTGLPTVDAAVAAKRRAGLPTTTGLRARTTPVSQAVTASTLVTSTASARHAAAQNTAHPSAARWVDSARIAAPNSQTIVTNASTGRAGR